MPFKKVAITIRIFADNLLNIKCKVAVLTKLMMMQFICILINSNESPLHPTACNFL